MIVPLNGDSCQRPYQTILLQFYIASKPTTLPYPLRILDGHQDARWWLIYRYQSSWQITLIIRQYLS